MEENLMLMSENDTSEQPNQNEQAEQTEQEDQTEEVLLMPEEPLKVKPLYELQSKRTANSKFFRMSDGTYQENIFNESIHYYDPQEKKFVDRSQAFEETDNQYISNNGDFRVLFSKNTQEDRVVSLEKKHCMLCWKPILPKSVKSVMAESNLQILQADEKKSEQTAMVVYRLEDVEYAYEAFLNRVKENILVMNKKSTYKYGFIMETENLEAEKSEETEEINFYSSTDEEKVLEFTIPKPYMVDAAGAFSEAVTFDLTELEAGKYLFTVTADAAWVNAEERTFPVTIDPEVIVRDAGYVDASMTTCEIAHNDTKNTSATTHHVGYEINGEHRTYFKIIMPSSQDESYRVISAHLSIKKSSYVNGGYQNGIQLREASANWLPSTITWNNQPALGLFIDSFSGISCANESTFDFDVSQSIRNWHIHPSENYGFVLKTQEDEFTGTYCCPSYFGFYSERASSANEPVLRINYKAVGEYADNQQTLTFDAKRGGTSVINLCSGNLTHVHNDVSVEGLKMPLSISHIFQEGLVSGKLNEFGYGWRISAKQWIAFNTFYNQGSDWYLKYYDAVGQYHLFRQYDDGSILDENGFRLNYNGCNNSGYQITDTHDNVMTFDAGTGYISSLKDCWNNTTTYEYDANNRLTVITDPSGHQAHLYYTNGMLSRIEDPHGRHTDYTYSNNLLTTITYPDGKTTVFTYDSNYNLTSVLDQTGLKNVFNYNTPAATDLAKVVSVTQQTNVTEIYQTSRTSSSNTTEGEVTNITYNQRTVLVEGKNHVRHVYSFDAGGRLNFVYEDTKNNSTLPQSVVTPVQMNGYQPMQNIHDSNDYVSMYRSYTAGNLGSYFDADQNTTVENNLLQNSTFANDVTGCYEVEDWALTGTDVTACYLSCVQDASKFSGMKSYQIHTSLSNTTEIHQAIFVNDTNCTTRKNNMMVASAWGKINSGTMGSNAFCQLQVVVNGDESSPLVANYDMSFFDWQFAAVPISIDKNMEVTTVKVSLVLYNCAATCNFTNIRLGYANGTTTYIQENQGGGMTVFGTHHTISRTVGTYDGVNTTVNNYDEHNDLICSRITNRDNRMFDSFYEYSNHLVTKQKDMYGLIKEYTYDTQGKLTSVKQYNEDFASAYMYQQKTYTSSGNYPQSDTDERGTVNNQLLKTQYLYNETDGVVALRTDPNDQATGYVYDSNTKAVKQVFSIVDNQECSVGYQYSHGLMTVISHNDFDYDFTFDGFGRTKEIAIGGSTILTKEYTIGEQNTETTTYATREKIYMTFDSRGNAIQKQYLDQRQQNAQIRQLSAASYDQFGNLISYVDNEENKTYNYKYDKRGNLIQQTTGGVSDTLTYEINNRLTQRTYGAVGQTYSFDYEKNSGECVYPSNQIISVALSGKFTNAIDKDNLRRLLDKKLTLNGASLALVQDGYGYLSTDRQNSFVGTHIRTVRGTNNTIDTYYYTYDHAGNIATIFKNGTSPCCQLAFYGYDGLSRLTEEHNYPANRKYIFVYDGAGNLLVKNEYELDTNTLVNEHSYIYAGSGWKDQLTYYDCQAITYDALGNPLTYRGNNLTWTKVRRLASFGSNTFSYNANGLRITKNGITYTLDGSRILRETSATRTLTYYYGVDGVVGFRYNNVDYYYLKNLQGDITDIIDTNGTVLVTYTYDAWGKVLNVADVSGINLGTINPFRYRSYYYDEETQLYYMESRYYDPEIGRFVNADSIQNLSKGGETEYNLFAYCGNSPVMLADPNGEGPISDLLDTIMSIPKKIGQFFTSTFGVASVSAYDTKLLALDNIICKYETGTSSSTVTSGNFDKPITFFLQTPSKWWRLWEYQAGVQVNIGDGGFSYSVGFLAQSISASVGHTAFELELDLNKVGFTVRNDVEWKNHTAGAYAQIYIRTIPPLLAVAAVLCGAWEVLLALLLKLLESGRVPAYT